MQDKSSQSLLALLALAVSAAPAEAGHDIGAGTAYTVDSATCLLKRYEGDRTQFYAHKFAREELLPEARKHLISALYTEPDNEEAVRLAVVYGFKYQEFAELSNAIREFPLSRPIWKKLHTAEEARLVEIARREKAAIMILDRARPISWKNAVSRCNPPPPNTGWMSLFQGLSCPTEKTLRRWRGRSFRV